MTTVERRTSATPAEVWRVLADGWTFAGWVVGASRVRAVEPAWPAAGSHVHHSVGSWPAVLDDDTEVVESVANEKLVMLARTRPVGEAKVALTLAATDGGTLIRMSEDFVTGPARLLPAPARAAALKVRNIETLRRLALMAERRTTP